MRLPWVGMAMVSREVFHEDSKGTQGPGHFTVRRVAPHYRAHPLRFFSFLEKFSQTMWQGE